MAENSFRNYVLQEITPLVFSLTFHVVKEVFACEARTTDDAASNSRVSSVALSREVIYECSDDMVVELIL